MFVVVVVVVIVGIVVKKKQRQKQKMTLFAHSPFLPPLLSRSTPLSTSSRNSTDNHSPLDNIWPALVFVAIWPPKKLAGEFLFCSLFFLFVLFEFFGVYSYSFIYFLLLFFFFSLSGGQKSRVAIAELAYKRPHVLLLDEPTNHLDMETIDSLVDGLWLLLFVVVWLYPPHAYLLLLFFLIGISRFEGAVIIISHNQHLIEAATNELWVVSKKGSVKRFKGEFQEYKVFIFFLFFFFSFFLF